MIKHMGRARKKGQQAWFVLLTPKWTQVKKLDEIGKIFKKRQSTRVFQAKIIDQSRSAKLSSLV